MGWWMSGAFGSAGLSLRSKTVDDRNKMEEVARATAELLDELPRRVQLECHDGSRAEKTSPHMYIYIHIRKSYASKYLWICTNLYLYILTYIGIDICVQMAWFLGHNPIVALQLDPHLQAHCT